MAEVTSDEVIAHGLEAAKVALEYIGTVVRNVAAPTDDESRAVVVAVASCIAALNTKLLQNCNVNVYKESQEMILRFMDAASTTISSISNAQKGKE